MSPGGCIWLMRPWDKVGCMSLAAPIKFIGLKTRKKMDPLGPFAFLLGFIAAIFFNRI
jgi:hypothetical protein